MSYVSGDSRHSEIHTLIKIYQEHNPDITREKKWGDYPKHIAMLLAELRRYCNNEGINFNECVNDSWDYEIPTEDNEQHF